MCTKHEKGAKRKLNNSIQGLKKQIPPSSAVHLPIYPLSLLRNSGRPNWLSRNSGSFNSLLACSVMPALTKMRCFHSYSAFAKLEK